MVLRYCSNNWSKNFNLSDACFFLSESLPELYEKDVFSQCESQPELYEKDMFGQCESQPELYEKDIFGQC